MFKILCFLILLTTSVLYGQETLSFDIGDWEPFTSSRDPDSQILELLVREIFQRNDIDVVFRYYPWARSIENVKKGNSVGSFPLMRTPDRDKTTICSKEPILIDEIYFFHSKNLPFDWISFDDLKDYRIGGTIGYAYMQPLVNYNLKVEYAPSEELNFKKLRAARLDIYPASPYVGNYLINKLFDIKTRTQFTYHPRAMCMQTYYFLVSKNHPKAQDIVDIFDEGIKYFKHNGRYNEILDLIPDLKEYKDR